MFGLKANIPASIEGIRVRENPRARRLALRVDARSGDIVLTWPRGARMPHAERFIADNMEWIQKQRAKIKSEKLLAPGARISVCGKVYEVVHRTGRGVTRFEGETLVVHGQPEHLARRLKDFLKKEAYEALGASVMEKLKAVGKKYAGIRVIDPKTRWGSCSVDGSMMFSWRLVLMPKEVMDYVVAHEVAHRVHMDHSRKFWALCASLTEHATTSRRWLKRHGSAIMAYQ